MSLFANHKLFYWNHSFLSYVQTKKNVSALSVSFFIISVQFSSTSIVERISFLSICVFFVAQMFCACMSGVLYKKKWYIPILFIMSSFLLKTEFYFYYQTSSKCSAFHCLSYCSFFNNSIFIASHFKAHIHCSYKKYIKNKVVLLKLNNNISW